MAYVTLSEFKAFIGNQQGTSDDTDLQSDLDAGERTVNEYCQRIFDVAGAASARTYAASATEILRIHDCTTVTLVTTDGTTVAATEYQTEPLNLLSWSGATRPIEQIRRLLSIWPVSTGGATISVTATWGWSAVPADVKQATRLIAKELLAERNDGSEQPNSAQAAQARLNPYVRQLLNPLRRVEAFGIA